MHLHLKLHAFGSNTVQLLPNLEIDQPTIFSTRLDCALMSAWPIDRFTAYTNTNQYFSLHFATGLGSVVGRVHYLRAKIQGFEPALGHP